MHHEMSTRVCVVKSDQRVIIFSLSCGNTCDPLNRANTPPNINKLSFYVSVNLITTNVYLSLTDNVFTYFDTDSVIGRYM